MEGFNITLKSRMWRYFTPNNTYRYVDVLQELVSGYNASPHKGIGMTHIEVNDSNQFKIRKKYYSQGVNRKPIKFAIRDHERICRDKGVFVKGYVQRWSEADSVIETCLELQTSSPFLVLYENRVKEHSWSGKIGLKISTVGSL